MRGRQATFAGGAAREASTGRSIRVAAVAVARGPVSVCSSSARSRCPADPGLPAGPRDRPLFAVPSRMGRAGVEPWMSHPTPRSMDSSKREGRRPRTTPTRRRPPSTRVLARRHEALARPWHRRAGPLRGAGSDPRSSATPRASCRDPLQPADGHAPPRQRLGRPPVAARCAKRTSRNPASWRARTARTAMGTPAIGTAARGPFPYDDGCGVTHSRLWSLMVRLRRGAGRLPRPTGDSHERSAWAEGRHSGSCGPSGQVAEAPWRRHGAGGAVTESRAVTGRSAYTSSSSTEMNWAAPPGAP